MQLIFNFMHDTWVHLKFIFWTVVFSFLFLLYVRNYIKKGQNLPPGPWGLPIFGCLLWIKESHHLWYARMAERYGSIMSLWLGSHLIVVISDIEYLRRFYLLRESTGRPNTPLNNLLKGLGVIQSENELWAKQRRFLLRCLRELKVVTQYRPGEFNRLENDIILEVIEFRQELEKEQNKAIDPGKLIGRHIHNVICQLMMSFRFTPNDVDFDRFHAIVNEGMELFGSLHFGEYINFLTKIPPNTTILSLIEDNIKKVTKFHKGHFDRRREVRYIFPFKDSILDYYLEQLNEEEDKRRRGVLVNSIFAGVDPETQILQIMNDLFSAGMETSKTGIMWTIVYMMHFPGIARKVRLKIREYVPPGDKNLVLLEHREQLSYVEATIYEILRLSYLVPLSTTHVNTEDWEVGGYTIPAGTHIIPLLNKVNMDPIQFPDPHVLRPERFLDENGSLAIPRYFMQFGIGRRSCLGVGIATMELFLFFANMMKFFEFSVPSGAELPKLQGMLASTHAPEPFEVEFKKIRQP